MFVIKKLLDFNFYLQNNLFFSFPLAIVIIYNVKYILIMYLIFIPIINIQFLSHDYFMEFMIIFNFNHL
jgi:hypothetical protein